MVPLGLSRLSQKLLCMQTGRLPSTPWISVVLRVRIQ